MQPGIGYHSRSRLLFFCAKIAIFSHAFLTFHLFALSLQNKIKLDLNAEMV